MFNALRTADVSIFLLIAEYDQFRGGNRLGIPT